MNVFRYLAFVTLVACVACGGGAGIAGPVSPTPTLAPSPSSGPRQLVWSDEFNGPSGAAVDNTKWKSDTGGDGHGNHEYEYYTNATDPAAGNYTSKNAHTDGQGNLVISAIAEPVSYATCWYGPCTYTSARLVTRGTFAQQYGRFEARMKIPPGQGLWPAFWMLGISNDWPNCGEIDVMEAIGKTPNVVYGSAHGPGYIGAQISGNYTLPAGNLSDSFHVYAVDWQPGNIQYFIDDVLYETITPANVPAGSVWVFDRQPFSMLVNLAVGGDWPGLPDANTQFPAQLLVDYVRVYK